MNEATRGKRPRPRTPAGQTDAPPAPAAATTEPREDVLRGSIDDLLNSIRDGFFSLDDDLRITYFNSAAETLLKRRRADVVGKGLLEAFPEARGSVFEDRYRLALRERIPVTFEVYFGVAPYENWYDVRVFPFNGGISVFFQVTTERKRAEQAIRRLNEDLALRNAELETSNQELEAFAYSVSHDLRAPLRSVVGFSKVLVEDWSDRLDATGRDYLQRIYAAGLRMDRLIEDLLALSRIIRREIEIGDVDLSDMAGEIAGRLAAASPERRIEFSIADGLKIRCDVSLIRIAIDNLLDNAVKFTAGRPVARIEFGSIDEDDRTVFFVKDNGVGFDRRYADRLFKPFQRLHTDDEFPGSGIGLATVSRIIKRFGGDLWAESEPGKGAAFYFTFAPECPK